MSCFVTDQRQVFSTRCYGNFDAGTPNTDTLAARGVCFCSGLLGAPLCRATHSVLLAGKHNRSWARREAIVHDDRDKKGSCPMPKGTKQLNTGPAARKQLWWILNQQPGPR